ncbi:MAG TPA: TonB-dependent receptor [Rhizomicrobium sp.]|nr:TonB-dependent receptor [Rhizomicrobium sp.]
MSVHALLLGGASALAMNMMSAPAMAQDNSGTDQNGIETVVVTGLIGSLQRNLDIKRDATGLVDAISAEDIGKFPDSNLAASMSRIPGVTISRGSNVNMGSNVPTSTGDATEITVRGFGPTFNETLFDGRQISTATGNRGFDFSGISADFVSQIDVLKSPDASLSAGALGATINIQYPKPFDHPGLRIAGALSSTYSPDAGKFTPNGNILVSDTFANDTFGVLVDFAYTETKTQANHINVQGWVGTTASQFGSLATAAAPTDPAWYIQDYGVYRENNDDKRINGRVVLQWRPNSSLLVTLNDDYSNDKLVQDQWGYSVWFNGGSLQNVTLDNSGTVTNFTQPNTPTDFQGAVNGNVERNNDLGLNVKWNVSENFVAELDADHAESWTNPGGELSSIDVDVGYGPSGAGGIYGTDVGINGIGVKSLPYPINYGPGGNKALFLDPNIIGSHVIPITSTQNYDAVNQVKVDGTWSNENLTIKFGFQYLSDRFHLKTYNDFTNNDWQAYSGYGPASNNAFGVALNPSWFGSSFGTSNFVPGFSNSGQLPPRVLKFNPYTVLNYLQSLGNPQTTVIPGANTNCCNPAFDGVYRTVLSPGSFQNIAEDNYAGFITLTDETKLGSWPLRITGAAREEFTDISSSGIGQVPVKFTVDPADHTAFDIAYGPTSIVTGKNSYQYLLPSLDLALSPTDDLQIRFDASRTMTRPPLNNLTPVYSIQAQRVGTVSAQGGNPDLLPFLSDNVDLSAEWYYQQNSYFAVDAFEKTVSNFVVSGTTQQTFAGVIDPTTGKDVQYSYSTFVNGPTANVYGVEFALQHVFSDTGFGVQANATIVNTNKPYDPFNLALNGFAVTGLADSANLVAFYEKNGLQVRVAGNWRAGYLEQFGQHQNGSIYGSEPTFVDPSLQIDMSASYDITDNISVYFEGLNLNDSTYGTHGRFKEQLLDAVDYGRRFTMGVHVKF